MKKSLPTFVCLLFIASPAAAQGLESCDTYGDVPIKVTPVFEAPRYDFSRNLAGIQALASDKQHSIPQYHAITMGITGYEPVLELHVPMTVKTAPNGDSCAYLNRIDITLGYRNVTVYIANEIPQNSCGFNETLAHEQKHIAVNQRVLEQFMPLVEERIGFYARINASFHVSKAADAEKLADEKLKDIMNEVTGKMQAENIRQQREVDTTEEYTRLSQSCGGELARIAGHFRQTGQ